MFEIGSVLADRYEIIDKINSGAMGAVYKAIDRRRGEENDPMYVAIKRYELADKSLPDNVNQQAQEAFLFEARVLERLRHPNLPRVIERSITGEWFAMDFIDGTNLYTELETVKKFEPNRVLNWTEQILDTLIYLHEKNGFGQYFHRDIKPANIILSKNGKITLIDFGLVTRTGTYLAGGGTPPYSAPEQMLNGPISPNYRA